MPNLIINFFVFVSLILTVICQDKNFVDLFSKCHKNDTQFDGCIEDAVNSGRQYFRTGLPQYGIPSFDPFIAKEVPQKIGVNNLNYRLSLINIYETGWAIAQYQQFKINLNQNTMQYTQLFPDKMVKGGYKLTANIYGIQINRQGSWSLAINNLVQTTTITRKQRGAKNGTLVYSTSLNLYVNIETIKDLEVHVTNLFNGHPVLEYVFDQIINVVWPLAFISLRPLANDLTTTFYTDQFRKFFENFPFNEIIH